MVAVVVFSSDDNNDYDYDENDDTTATDVLNFCWIFG